MTGGELIRSILNKAEKRRFAVVLGLMLIYSLFESLGLALIVPFVEVLRSPVWAEGQARDYLGWEFSWTQIVLGSTVLIASMISVKSLLQIAMNRSMARFPYEFYQAKAKQLFDVYLKQDYLSFVRRNTGSFVKNCTHTVDHCATAIVHYLHYVAAAIITAFLVILLLCEFFYLSLAMMVLFSSIAYLIHRWFSTSQRKAGQERESTYPKFFQTISDALFAFKEVKLYDKQPHFLHVFDQCAGRLAKANESRVFYPNMPVIIIEYVGMLVLLAMVLFWVVTDSQVSALVAPLLFFGAVARRLLPAVNHVVSHRVQLEHYAASLQCLKNELEGIKPEARLDCVAKRTFERALAFQNVSFAYQKDNEVLHEVSFCIAKNSSVAFVGTSGAGKSTLMDVFISLLEPSSGEILVDDLPVGSLSQLRGIFGYVPQDICLLDGTLAENIAFGYSEVDPECLEKVLRMTHLQGFVDALELGVDTPLGERGVRLSGGQKQRVGIARALYHGPEILVFDEATSSLDNVSEAVIAQAIREMAGKKTIIAIAHRLSTVEAFDLIYVMDAGRIVASGTHTELLEECELYRRLWGTRHEVLT